MPSKYPDVYSTGEVAKICKVAPRTVSKWFDSGWLAGYRIPGSSDRRVPRASLVKFMKAHGMPCPAWVEPVRLAYGVPAAEVPAGWTHCVSQFDLAVAVATEPDGVGALVVGDADGVTAAADIATRVLARHPGAAVTVVVDPSVSAVPGWAGRVVVRPADVAAALAGAA